MPAAGTAQRAAAVCRPCPRWPGTSLPASAAANVATPPVVVVGRQAGRAPGARGGSGTRAPGGTRAEV
eukprot:gene25648-biopygen1473